MTADEPEIVALALRRRSVRSHYLRRPVPRPVLSQILRCGLAAPASKGAHPWRFTVVEGAERLEAIADDVASAPGGEAYTPHDPATGSARPAWSSTVQESADVLRTVPAAIFVENLGPFSGGRQALLGAPPKARALAIVGYELELAGLGAAIQSMWLAAVGFGLSAVFMGDVAVAEPAIARRLGLTGDLLGALALGYATVADEPPRQVPTLDAAHVRWDDDVS